MSNLSEILKRQAESLNACRKGVRYWPTTPEGLIQRWKNNLDFAIENNFPSSDFIKDNFDPALLHDNLIYVDEHLNIEDALSGVYVLNGECSGTIRFGSWAAATVYVRHTSKVSIIAENFAKVFVRLYDSAEAEVLDMGDASVRVYDRR